MIIEEKDSLNEYERDGDGLGDGEAVGSGFASGYGESISHFESMCDEFGSYGNDVIGGL